MSFNKDSKAILFIYIQLILSLCLALGYGFMSPFYLPAAKPVETKIPKVSNKLVLVLMDGMRKDYAFDPKLMPNIYRLSQEGASGVSKTSNFALTIAAMRAIGSGVPYSARDIFYNYQRAKAIVKTDTGKVRIANKQSLDDSIDSIFQEAHKQGRKIVLSGDDIWINCYGSAISEAILAKGDAETPHGTTDDSEIHAGALKFLEEGDFDILIIHYQSLDRTGHNNTPLSGKYRKKALEVDHYVAELEQHLPPETTLFIFSDHGMSDNGWHGKLDNPPPIVTEPPFIFAKNKIAKVQNLSVPQVDLAPTLSLLLGLPIPAQSEGIVITDIFNLDEKQKAELLLANFTARNNYLSKLQKETNQNFGLLLNDASNAAQIKYQEGNFSQSINLAQKQLQEVNQEVERKIKFNVSPLVKAYLALSVTTFILLIATSDLVLNWLVLAMGLFTLLVISAGSSIYILGLSDPVKTMGLFLSITLVTLSLLVLTLLYNYLQNKDKVQTRIFIRAFSLFLIACLILTIAIPNTFTNLTMVLILMASFGFAYKYKDTLLNRTLVFYGLAIFAIFDRLINETFFLENKLFKILITLLASIFIGLCVKNFTNFYRSALFVGAIFAGTLTLLQFTSKLEFIYTFLFITTCLAMIYSISKEPAEKFLLKIIVGLFLLIKIPIILNSSIVKPILERQLIHQFSFYTSFDVVALLTALLLCYYIYQQKIGKQKTAESNILSKKDFVLFLLPHLALLSGLIGRLLLHNPIRNELGKFSLLLLGINLLLSCITPIKSEYKPYILYISLISLSVLVFEPAQIFLFSSVVFFQVWVSYNSSFINNEIILMVLYLVFSFVVYFSSYGNISLSSFFEEGRYPILGGQITDYSYWNLTIIISFLVSKLVLVESIGLLFLRNICNKLDYTVRLLVGVFSITILILLGLAWYRYSPGNQQFLANISSTLLFIGIKTVIFTLGLLLTNLFGVKTEVQETQKGISMQEANLIA